MSISQKTVSLLTALALLAGAAAVQAAGYLYRYKDANGRPVIARSIPPEFVDGGYEVLTESMRIVKVIPPADVREKILAEEKQRKEREAKDRRLLRTYNSVAEAEEAKQRKVTELELFVDSKKKGIDGLQKNLADTLQNAADLERRGKPVTPAILKNIDALKVQIQEEQTKLLALRKNLQEVRGRYSDDIERLRELLEGVPPKAPEAGPTSAASE